MEDFNPYPTKNYQKKLFPMTAFMKMYFCIGDFVAVLNVNYLGTGIIGDWGCLGPWKHSDSSSWCFGGDPIQNTAKLWHIYEIY